MGGSPSFVVGGCSSSPEAFIDACAQEGRVSLIPNADEGFAGGNALPFPFVFYSVVYNSFWVSSNGTMGFGTTGVKLDSPDDCLPSALNARPAIFAFGEDLQTRQNGVCIATVGTAPSRKLVVTWNNAGNLPGSGGVTGNQTFSIVLAETTFTIDLLYQSMSDQGATALVGLQDANGVISLQHSCDQPVIAAGTKLRFTP